MHDVSKSIDHLIDLLKDNLLVFLNLSLLGLIVILLLDFFLAGICLVCLFLVLDDSANIVPLFLQTV